MHGPETQVSPLHVIALLLAAFTHLAESRRIRRGGEAARVGVYPPLLALAGLRVAVVSAARVLPVGRADDPCTETARCDAGAIVA